MLFTIIKKYLHKTFLAKSSIPKDDDYMDVIPEGMTNKKQ